MDAEPDIRNLKAALWYAHHGWLVFPVHSCLIASDGPVSCTCGKPECQDIAKHPASAHGLYDGTTEGWRIRQWWDAMPRANIGIATGAGSGIVVVDVDPRKGGSLALEDLIAEHGPLPITPESHTGGGGLHLVFQHPGVPIRNKVDLRPGLDIRGDGGYIVVPPSRHASTREYEWEVSSSPKQVTPAAMPAWLLAILQEPAQSKVLANTPEGPIPEGQRNATLARYAGAMRRQGMTTQEITTALLASNQRCVPSLPRVDVEKIAASIGRYAPAIDISSEAPDSKGLFGIGDAVDPLIWVGTAEEKAIVTAAGFRSCVSVPEIPPMKANYRKHLAYLATVEQQLMGIKKHILVFHHTAEGRALREELTRRLGPERAWYVSWPNDCETIEHVMIDHGLDTVAEMLRNACESPVPDIVSVDMVEEGILDWYDHGCPQGVKPGWTQLDNKYRVFPGELTAVTATPSTGKSRWLNALLLNIAEREDWSFTIFSPESGDPKKQLKLLLRQYVRKPFEEGFANRMTRAEVQEGMAWIRQHFTFLWPKQQLPTVDHILELAKIEVFRHSIKGIVIDPWNRVVQQRGDHQTETEYIAESLIKIQQFLQIHALHGWVVVHPSKIYAQMPEGGGRAKFPVVTPNMLHGSAHWWNMPDNILSLWRDITNDEDDGLDIYTPKVRFEEAGRMGYKAQLVYHKASATYSDKPGML